MKKSEVLEIGKYMSKEIFRFYLESIEGDFGILDDDVEVIGLKEYEDKYRIMFILPKIEDIYCEILCEKNTKRMYSQLYRRFDI